MRKYFVKNTDDALENNMKKKEKDKDRKSTSDIDF